MIVSYCDVDNNFTEFDLPEQGGIIGYDERCFIVLDELGVSAMHMRLTADGERLFVEDLQSLNGTFVNDSLITEKTELYGGEMVLAGTVIFSFEKNQESWSITAARQDSSLFVIDESDPWFDTVVSEESATAVTVIASKDVQEAVRNNNIEPLLDQMQSSTAVPERVVFSPDSLQELGRYRIIKKIGKGGMGVVYLAKHKVMNNYRALKVLPHSVREQNNDFFERFMREARIASEIRHPNIVGVMDAETDPEQGVSYIVMEFIDGGTLRRILKHRNVLPEVQALLIVRSVAEALNAIAEHKIIHRDIKPDNIMFTRHGEVKLADLGIAKNTDEDVDLTRNDVMIGTPAYLSPEQIERPKDVDIRSDIYSLGATLYEMLTGVTPYAGKNTYDILQKMLSESIVNPRRKNSQVSRVTAGIVMKMLHKNPDKRYQSPRELLDVLNGVLQHYSGQAVQSIIKSAVLGTEYPQGMKKRLPGGLFGRMFSRRYKSGNGGEALPVQSGSQTDGCFTFQLEKGFAGGTPVDFAIYVPAAGVYTVTAGNGASMDFTAGEDCRLELKGVTAGEYKITRQEMPEA